MNDLARSIDCIERPIEKDFTVPKQPARHTIAVITHRRTHKRFALKRAEAEFGGFNDSRVLEEASILSSDVARESPFLNHAHAIYRANGGYSFVLELCDEGDLFAEIEASGGVTERRLRAVAAELVLAIEVLQTANITHRDIKPENILRKGKHIVLADFGLSTRRSNDISGSYGTLGYRAPEIQFGATYDHRCDIWSLGVTLYMMWEAHPPVEPKRVQSLQDDPTLPLWHRAPPAGFADLITALLRRDPAKRPTLEEIKAHAFFEGVNWDAVERHAAPKRQHWLRQRCLIC